MPQAARSNRAVDPNTRLAPSRVCRNSTQVGELAERQGTAMLTRRDLRVGQVRLLHSPPIFCSPLSKPVQKHQKKWPFDGHFCSRPSIAVHPNPRYDRG